MTRALADLGGALLLGIGCWALVAAAVSAGRPWSLLLAAAALLVGLLWLGWALGRRP